MSAADAVLAARYRVPRTLFGIDTTAPKPVQQAQLGCAHGLARAEAEMRSAHFEPRTAQHLARMAVLMFLSEFDGNDLPVGTVYDALIARVNAEGWIGGCK